MGKLLHITSSLDPSRTYHDRAVVSNQTCLNSAMVISSSGPALANCGKSSCAIIYPALSSNHLT